MAGRGPVLLGAVGGCIAASIPLLIGDLVATQSPFSVSEAVIAGMAGLFGGIVLGGIVAGVLAGRRGGAQAATWAGLGAAVLYAVVVVTSLLAWSKIETDQASLLAHPLSLVVGLIFVGTLLALIALLTGVIVRPRLVASTASRTVRRSPNTGTRPASAAADPASAGRPPHVSGPQGGRMSMPRQQSQPARRR